mgnify:CR=1 FL=1
MEGYRLGLYEKAMPDELSLEEKLLLAKKSGLTMWKLVLMRQRRKFQDWILTKRKMNCISL